MIESFSHSGPNGPIDANATPQTVALFRNLWQISADSVLFGHQSAMEYGHGWSNEPGRSDVKSVCGSHPAVVGTDFMGLSGVTRSREEIEKQKESLRAQIVATYERGGITTVAWHFHNPVTDTSFYWKEGESAAAVPHILPGGSHHEAYREILGTIADLSHSLKAADGTLAPVIFRPYHEFDGNWFWWGRAHCTREEFIELWRFTVGYLRDELKVRNFLYAFSPDRLFDSEAEFLDRYPGDSYVDMVGMDNYGDFGRDGKYNLEAGLKKLKIVSDFARRSGKLAAFTETGLESIPHPTWWTDVLLQTLKSDLKLAYVLVWRNDKNSPTHYYAPFPGHSCVPDFMEFARDPFTKFEPATLLRSSRMIWTGFIS